MNDRSEGVGYMITLKRCSGCEKIEVSGGPKVWMPREGNETLYDNLIEQYEGRIFDIRCPPCSSDQQTGRFNLDSRLR